MTAARAAPLAELLASPRLLDVIIAAVVVEGVALVVYRRRTSRGMPAREVVSFLGSGVALMLALRTAVAAAPGTGTRGVFLGAMAAALVLHVWHVVQRRDV